MESSIIVIFYSKYSPRCTEFFNLVRDVIDFRKICVDHPEIRTTLLNEKDKYSIRKVPTVIVFFSNGVMNKYEDEKAFEWAYNVRQSMMKPEKSHSPTYFQKQVTEIVVPPTSSIPTGSIPTGSIPAGSIPAGSIPAGSIPAGSIPTGSIPAGSIPVEPITEQQRENYKQQPEEDLMGMKRRIETTPLIQRPAMNDDQRMDGNRNDRKVHDKKQDSIKNLAQQLQAEREKEDEQINPNAISKIIT